MTKSKEVTIKNLIELFIKGGCNEQTARKWVEENFSFVRRCYPDVNLKQAYKIIRSVDR